MTVGCIVKFRGWSKNFGAATGIEVARSALHLAMCNLIMMKLLNNFKYYYMKFEQAILKQYVQLLFIVLTNKHISNWLMN